MLGALVFAQSPGRDPFAPLPPELQIDLADRDRVERIANGVVDRRFEILEQLLVARVEERAIERSENLRSDLAEEVLRLERSVFGDVGLAEENGLTLLQRLAAIEQRLADMTAELAAVPTAETAPIAPIDLTGEGYEFIACVNGQPLFRAPNGATFYAEQFQLAPGRSLCGS
jgi:hypothetical protein